MHLFGLYEALEKATSAHDVLLGAVFLFVN